MATSPDDATRKRRIDELEAKRQRIEAEIAGIQGLGRLSALNAQLAEITNEINRLREEN